MTHRPALLLLLPLLLGYLPPAWSASGDSAAPEPTRHDCPMMEERAAGVNRRGDQGMGFDHTRTTHHFRLSADGGAIEVTANDPADSASRDQIRMHLRHVAGSFGDGDFALPMFIHGQLPSGVPVMQRLKSKITYAYEEMERGARVRIVTADPDALAAVHDFLRFQIQDHRTGDPQEAPPR